MGGATYTTGYAYDADGNRTTVTYPSSFAVNYTYDFANRQIAVLSGATTWVSSASYLPFGPLTSLSYGNGMTKTIQYDNRYRVTDSALANGSFTIAHYT